MKLVFSLIVCYFLAISTAYSQAKRGEPVFQVAGSSVYIANRTNGKIVFYLETKNTKRTEHTLGPNQAATFSGESGDKWFNIEVYSNNGQVEYGLNASARYYISWRPDKVLDVYRLPPR